MDAWRRKTAGPLVGVGLILLAICAIVYEPGKPAPDWLWWPVGVYAALSLPIVFWPK